MADTLNALMGRLRIRQLNLLIALDEHRSLHRAAAALSITQSAASKSLAEVESMIEAPLFERSKSGIVPNQLGQCVIRYARLLRTPRIVGRGERPSAWRARPVGRPSRARDRSGAGAGPAACTRRR